jgi:gliding motility-associated-like protein
LTTSAGCAESSLLDSAIYVLVDPKADFKFEKQDGNIFSPGVQFLNESEFSSDFEWSFGDFTFSEDVNPFHLYPSTITDSYRACLTAFNSLGCPDTTCKVVTIEPEFLVSIPNAFSPDGDNVNDYFVPVFNDIPLAEYSLLIFDRNGRVVFESAEQGERWDGSGAIDENYFSADGIYHYKLVIREFNRPEKQEYSGFVTVLR